MPDVSASGTVLGWHNKPAVARLSATDALSGPALVRAIVGGVTREQTGALLALTIAAPANHKNDGLHAVSYTAEDLAGNWAPTQRFTVGIDTRKPQTKAPSRSRVIRGRYVILKYEVLDAKPNGGKATVTIDVRSSQGKSVKKLVIKNARVNTVLRYRFRCTLKKGTYKFYVYAIDLAGSRQSYRASNALIVR